MKFACYLWLIFSIFFSVEDGSAQPYKPSPPLKYGGEENLTISGYSIKAGSGPCIVLKNCRNVHITKCRLSDGTTINATGIEIDNCTNVTIDYNFITKVATGVYAHNSTGVNVNLNQFLNMMGPYPRGSYVQFNNINGVGNRITNNKGDNIAGESNPEDGINIYKSSGLAADPILVSGNMLRGGGPSVTGSGITVGDQGGSYITVVNNFVINTGNIGMQVTGGTNITMINNTIYSDASPISHLGLSCGNYSGQPMNNITIGGNKVKWLCGKVADLAYYPKGTTIVEKDISVQAGLAQPSGWATNLIGAPISASVIPTTLVTMK